jgi:hypothetical protein
MFLVFLKHGRTKYETICSKTKYKNKRKKPRLPQEEIDMKMKKERTPLDSSFLVIPRLISPVLPFSFTYWLRRLHVCAKLDLSSALLAFNMFLAWLKNFTTVNNG